MCRKVILILLCTIGTWALPLRAQEMSISADSWTLPPLDTLQELALQHSPTLKTREALLNKSKAQLAFARQLWQNNIMGNINLATGNQNLLMLGSAGDLQNTSITNGYRAGLNINIPLYEFFGRSSRIQLHQAELDAARFTKEESVLQLKRLVQQEYFGLMAAQRVLKIRADARESAEMNALMAEEQFRQGVISISELARVKELTSKALVEYEQAYADFFAAYHQLEELLGVSLKTLMP